MKDLTVIITHYNNIPYILYLISYFKNKNYDNIEIILIDDASPQSIFDYTNSLGCIKYVKNEVNMGIGYVRQQGLDLALGKYITYIDGDDIVTFDFLDTILDNIKTNFDVYDFEAINYPLGVKMAASDMVWKKVYKKDFLLKNNCKFKNIRSGEDIDFYNKLLSHNPQILKVNKIIYLYNLLSNGITHTSFLEEVNERLSA